MPRHYTAVTKFKPIDFEADLALISNHFEGKVEEF